MTIEAALSAIKQQVFWTEGLTSDGAGRLDEEGIRHAGDTFREESKEAIQKTRSGSSQGSQRLGALKADISANCLK